MTTSSLTLLALQHPLILLPTSRFTVPVPQPIGEAILDLFDDQSDALPVVAVVPLTSPPSPDPDSPIPLGEWGSAARVLRLVKPPARNPRQPYLVSLHGLTRIRLIHQHEHKHKLPLLAHSLPSFDVEYPQTEKVPTRESIDRFKHAALRLLDRLAKDAVQPARKDGYTKIANMLDDIADARTPWMADVLIASINTDYSDKLAILSTPDTTARLTLAADIFLKQTSISEVSKKIASAVDDSLSKQQKEFFLRQQLAAIQRELSALQRGVNIGSSTSSAGDVTPPGAVSTGTGTSTGTSELDDDEQHEADDLADLKRKIEAMEPGSEERKMGVREWRRLKRIPQGSVENGVIRTYLEWLTSIPWPNSSLTSTILTTPTPIKDKAFLTNARAQLDADHFGLEKIKKRLIEYLAVVRLKELNAEKEAQVAAAAAAEEAAKQTTANPSDNASNDNKALIPVGTTSPTPSPPTIPSLRNPTPRGRNPNQTKPPILLFVGPPGTGKTSLGQSIARALGRPFQRISLGGVRDEAEIRGHRRTYVASGPGLIVQALRKSSRPDPLILLDEIDKIGQSNFHGDPAAALLEVLDPEQNWGFNDHYVNVPVDLSGVLWICTANSLEGIQRPLLDRCEIVQLGGYTWNEKKEIARKWLIPKQVRMNGMGVKDGGVNSSGAEEKVVIPDETIKSVIHGWTREAGVRSLERAIAALVRFKAVQWAEWVEKCEKEGKEIWVPVNPPVTGTELVSVSSSASYNPVIPPQDLEQILGLPRFDPLDPSSPDNMDDPSSPSLSSSSRTIGVVNGLVVMGQGEGGILPVETLLLPGGSGKLKLTGSLGEVIKESGELALSWVRRHAWDLGIVRKRGDDLLKSGAGLMDDSQLNKRKKRKKSGDDDEQSVAVRGAGGVGTYSLVDVHLHLPAGAQRKDGPSAGVAMTCALVSLFTGECVPSDVAMTGEITLRGRVTPVGGIKEKVLGAHRSGITKVILPYSNRKDVEFDVPKEVKESMKFRFVRNLEEALEEAFGKGVIMGRRNRNNNNTSGHDEDGVGDGDMIGGVSDDERGGRSGGGGGGDGVGVYERRGVGVLVESRL